MVEGLCSSDSGGVRQARRRVGVERELGLLLGAGAGALGGRARARRLDPRLGRAVVAGASRSSTARSVRGRERRRAAGWCGAAASASASRAGAHGGGDLGHDAVVGRTREQPAGSKRGAAVRDGRGGSASARRARASAARLARGPGAVGGAGDGAAGQAVRAGVEQHRALAEEAQEAADLGPGDAERVGRR